MIIYLTSKGAACQNLTLWMTTTSASCISFIQSSFLTKIIGLDSNSNLIFVVKISAQSKMFQRFGIYLVQGGLVLDCVHNVKYGVFLTSGRPFLEQEIFFMIFLC